MIVLKSIEFVKSQLRHKGKFRQKEENSSCLTNNLRLMETNVRALLQ